MGANLMASEIPRVPFVFLGGSCNPTTWRRDIAIPLLANNEVPLFNPQVEEWYPELMALENRAKEAAAVNLFVIDQDTRALMSIIEAVEYIATQRPVAVAVLPDLHPGFKIGGDEISASESKDLNRARGYLRDVASRFGVDVHGSVESAVQDAIEQVHAARERSEKQQQKDHRGLRISTTRCAGDRDEIRPGLRSALYYSIECTSCNPVLPRLKRRRSCL